MEIPQLVYNGVMLCHKSEAVSDRRAHSLVKLKTNFGALVLQDSQVTLSNEAVVILLSIEVSK